MSVRNIYLAGPFFNDLERGTIAMIEDHVGRQQHCRLFSPRRDGGNAERQGSLEQNAQAIFDANLNAMRECDECFAILDRPLPENQQLWICYRDPAVDTIKEIRRINSQPDIGTVWELGYLRGWRDLILSTDCELEVAGKWCGRKVLAGFTTTPRDAGGKMNIMLARCLDVVIHGFGELAEWFSHVNATQALADFEERGLAQWKGQVQ